MTHQSAMQHKVHKNTRWLSQGDTRDVKLLFLRFFFSCLLLVSFLLAGRQLLLMCAPTRFGVLAAGGGSVLQRPHTGEALRLVREKAQNQFPLVRFAGEVG